MFNNTSLIENEDLISIDNCTEPVGDDKDGMFAIEAIDGLLHETFTLSVESACCLIQNQQIRIAEDGTRQ